MEIGYLDHRKKKTLVTKLQKILLVFINNLGTWARQLSTAFRFWKLLKTYSTYSITKC